jgi:uncharacterized protein YjbI with pentapeptide repeats
MSIEFSKNRHQILVVSKWCTILTIMLIFSVTPSFSLGWQGSYKNGRIITNENLRKILDEHKKWLSSNGRFGRQADLSSANLQNVNLKYAALDKAIFSLTNFDGADFSHASLKLANFNNASLIRANFDYAQLEEASFKKADMTDARLKRAKLKNAKMGWAILEDANLREADLTGADFHRSNLLRANLSWTSLRKADLSGADLTGADLRSVKMEEADFSGANLEKAIFEPLELPIIGKIATSKGLEYIRYRFTPDPIENLKKAFEEEGFTKQAKLLEIALEY